MPVVGGVTRWVVENGRRVAGQTIVSLTATICVAAITQSFLKKPEAPAEAPAHQSAIHELAALDLLKSMFGPGGARTRALYPSEFEAVAPPSLPHELATPSVVVLREPAAPAPAAKPRAAAPTPVALLPPARPTETTSAAPVPMQVAEAPVQSRPATQTRLLGIPLPRVLVATGEVVGKSGDLMVSSVVSLGSTIGSLTSRLLPD